MVAQKKGRGGKAAAAKAKAAQVEEPVQEVELENAEAEENNGEAELMDQSDSALAEDGGDQPAGADQSTENADNNEGEAKAEEKKEEKVESGKLLVENLPPSYLFDYQEKLKELFSTYGEVSNVKRGPIIVTELTTTPTLSAIVEFKNKDSLEKALSEQGTVIDGNTISVAVESRAETAVLVGVPYEASTDYVKLLFTQCGEVSHIHEFSKTKYKILRVTFFEKEAAEKALKLDRELRINGFLVTVSKYRDEDEQKAHNQQANKKRQHPQQQNRQNTNVNANNSNANNQNNRQNNYRARGAAATGGFNNRGGGGGRGRGFGNRGGAGGQFGRAPYNSYLPPQPYMPRPGGFMNDGQRPNKRPRQM